MSIIANQSFLTKLRQMSTSIIRVCIHYQTLHWDVIHKYYQIAWKCNDNWFVDQYIKLNCVFIDLPHTVHGDSEQWDFFIAFHFNRWHTSRLPVCMPVLISVWSKTGSSSLIIQTITIRRNLWPLLNHCSAVPWR
jgi:hypothetical protein